MNAMTVSDASVFSLSPLAAGLSWQANSITGHVPQHFYPADELMVSYNDADLAKISRDVAEIVQFVKSMSVSCLDLSAEIYVDYAEDFSYQSAYEWTPVELDVVSESERKFNFEGDEHRDVWS